MAMNLSSIGWDGKRERWRERERETREISYTHIYRERERGSHIEGARERRESRE